MAEIEKPGRVDTKNELSLSNSKKMLKLREELLAVEEDRNEGRNGCILDELDAYLDEMIE